MQPKRLVYILKSDQQPGRYYTGLTSDVRARLAFHNEGLCRHTATGRPWRVDVVVEFTDERRAVVFERYSPGPAVLSPNDISDSGPPENPEINTAQG